MSEKLTLSEELRRAREGRGETLDQVNQRTGISLTVLKALEEGDLEAVEAVYLRLAVVHYGNYLGLDGHELAQGFEGRRSSARVVRRLPRDRGTGLGGGLAKAVAVAAVAGLLAVLYVLKDGQGDTAPPPAPAAGEPAAAPPPSPPPEADAAAGRADLSPAPGEPSPAAVPGAAGGDLEGPADAPPEAVTAEVAEEAVAGARMVLEADVLDTVWVRVGRDGVDSVMETVPGGEQRTWRAERFFVVHAGRSGNIRFRFQGQLLAGGRLGEPGRTLRFRVSADGYQLLGPDLNPIGPVTGFQPERTEPGQPGVR